MKPVTTQQLLDISIDLTREKDGDHLLEKILRVAMDITECDGGTLYVYQNNTLSFKIMITKSLSVIDGGRHSKITLPPVPIARTNVCACAVLENRLINIPDVYTSEVYDFSGPRMYDAMTGYSTKSMLVIPMEDNDRDIIGVLQLINAMDEHGAVVPFMPECEPVVQALASQAAISLTNMNYADKMRGLMDSVVHTLSTAIHVRTPYNVTHTANMAKYGERFITWLNAQNREWSFSEAQKRQFLMTIWLHDVGKLTIPLEIMNKETRMSGHLERLMTRLDTIGLLGRIHALENGESCGELLEKIAYVKSLVTDINSSGYLPAEKLARVQEVAGWTYLNDHGVKTPWLTQEEVECLSIPRGTLTPRERRIMESHVVMTAKILEKIDFYGDYARVPLWAGQHHEFLNQTGYPNKLDGRSLDREVRLLTIIDIFDGLSAVDRPYKKANPLESVFQILREMGREGKLDEDILALFFESRVWEDGPWAPSAFERVAVKNVE